MNEIEEKDFFSSLIKHSPNIESIKIPTINEKYEYERKSYNSPEYRESQNISKNHQRTNKEKEPSSLFSTFSNRFLANNVLDKLQMK